MHMHLCVHGTEGDEGVEQSQLQGLSAFDKKIIINLRGTSYRDLQWSPAVRGRSC